MRSEHLFLADIVEAVDAIAEFLVGQDRKSFISNDQVRSAVVYKLLIIGEATGRLSSELRARHPNVPWRKAMGMRHYAAHGYFALDWDIIWDTATNDVPPLRDQIVAVLAEEFSESE